MANSERNYVIEVISGLLSASWSVGDCQQIEDFLGGVRVYDMLTDEGKREALIAVIHTEIELRRKAGQSPSGAEYADRFPTVGRKAIDDVIGLPSLPTEQGPPIVPRHPWLLRQRGATSQQSQQIR